MAAFPMDSNGRMRNSVQQDDSQPALFSFYNPNPASNRSSLQSLHSARSSMPQISRRFTTTNLPTAPGLPSIGQQRMNTFDSQGQDFSFSKTVADYLQKRERKEAEYNFIKKKRLQFQQEMNALEREEQRLRHDLGGYGAGNQSEPATPPEQIDNGFPSVFSRPNRFSSSSIISPIGQSARSSRAGSQATSPSERDRAYLALTGFSPQSTSRESGDGEEDDEYQDEVLNFDHRKAASLNRNSMPVTRRDHGARNGVSDVNSVLGHVNTTAFLFGDEYKKGEDMDVEKTPTSTNLPTYLQMHTNDDKFPILVRRDGETEMSVPETSEVTSAQAKDFVNGATGWPSFGRQSAPYSVSQSNDSDSPPQGFPYPSMSGSTTPTTSTATRHSMGARIGPTGSETKRSSFYNGSIDQIGKQGVGAKLQPSFSTSSVPTMNSMNNVGNNTQSTLPASTSTAEQRLHNHNVSLGRIPPSAIGSKRQSRDMSASEIPPEDHAAEIHSNQTTPSGPADTAHGMTASNTAATGTFGNPAVYGYGGAQPNIQMLDGAMNNMSLQTQAQPQAPFQQWSSPTLQMYSQPYMGVGYTPFQNFGRFPENPARPAPQRRAQHGEDSARFANVTLENLEGEILTLCKDQHGCRFLQKKLEERKPEHIQMIFAEIKDHMIELMIDPFGNYLCQKLLESTEDDQRTQLIDNAAPEMVAIALNQHGTRALQKMIEFVTTPAQIQTVTRALEHSVVPMIQDLNGNHVIQKCLNRLSNTDAQFIFDAVAAHCVTVGTHRHGCCVIQRCIDHASPDQKAQLVAAISGCSMSLVQDPFGNYVLQYIFDLEEPSYSQPLCRTFLGEIVKLSKQKFSSNVVEKCLRIADDETRHSMIQEIINAHEFDKIADDPFANYVVQTAWDHANATDEAQLAEKIRPCLPRMRHKPYGRRFQNKVAERDKKLGINTSGTITPSDLGSPDSIPSQQTGFSTPFSQYSTLQSPQNGQNGFANLRSPYGMQMPAYMQPYGGQVPRMDNQPAMSNFTQYPPQNTGHQGYGTYNRNPHHGTGWY